MTRGLQSQRGNILRLWNEYGVLVHHDIGIQGAEDLSGRVGAWLLQLQPAKAQKDMLLSQRTATVLRGATPRNTLLVARNLTGLDVLFPAFVFDAVKASKVCCLLDHKGDCNVCAGTMAPA
jgi:hypothetical protein